MANAIAARNVVAEKLELLRRAGGYTVGRRREPARHNPGNGLAMESRSSLSPTKQGELSRRSGVHRGAAL